jgi:hypothetical protein
VQALTAVTVIPLGLFYDLSAYRKELTGGPSRLANCLLERSLVKLRAGGGCSRIKPMALM